MENIVDWVKENSLDCEISYPELIVDNKKYLILEHTNNKIFNEDFEFILPDYVDNYDCDFYLYYFGTKWYWSDKDKVELNIFKYVGEASSELGISFPYLGIHGRYDLCNGSRDYGDWIKKAKFLNISTLGICETNTLAGTISFQLKCKEAGVKSIIGETITVRRHIEESYIDYDVKLYATNDIGWQNLLKINAEINAFSEGRYIDEELLIERGEFLIIAINTSIEIDPLFIRKLKKSFFKVYYQFDLVEWSSDEKDKFHLTRLKEYFNKYQNICEPVLICDSYYLDKSDSKIKRILNSIGKIGFVNQSKDQYFKSLEDIFSQLNHLVNDSEKAITFLEKCLDNLEEIESSCNLQIETKKLHLPEYEMDQSEASKYETNEDLFWGLVESGIENKIQGTKKDLNLYLERVEIEFKVIQKGNIINYFLILADIIKWSRNNGILVAPGRGSSAGSLIAYLLDVTRVDPIEYDLLFERFLNEARLLNELPDIDTDFEGLRRDDVKRYMEQKYGFDYVCSIGTYGNLKTKSGIKDISRFFGINYNDVNYISSIISGDEEDSLLGLFKEASKEPKLKAFIKEYPEVVESLELCLGQPKNSSIHASATIIIPKYNGMNIYNMIPVKAMDGVLVSEWEGKQIEKAGYLKEDILGIAQLDKFRGIVDLIKENEGIDLELESIPLDDDKVFSYFHDGLNEDVFQFGTPGLKGYCLSLKPDSIHELIAANALHRPGPMDVGAHNDFVKIKFGDKIPDYDPLLEEITKDTYSIYIYQEQIMQSFQEITGASLQEADIFRKVITKLKSGVQSDENFNKYKTMFVDAYIAKGVSQIVAIQVWEKLVAFARYGFNKSHAASYSIMGYWSQWLKVHYPLEFWAVSLLSCKDDEKPNRLSEINKIDNIKIAPPDINNSEQTFKISKEKKTIYWAISSIKYVGEKAVEAIISERTERGDFYSFEDFFERINKTTVNKRVITNLILSGAFDDIEKVKSSSDRYLILVKLFGEENIPELYDDKDEIWKDYFWELKSKESCGYGYINTKAIYIQSPLSKKANYVDNYKLFSDEIIDSKVSVCGVLKSMAERKSKNGKFCQLTLDSNNDIVYVTVWSDTYETYKTDLSKAKDKAIVLNGVVRYDSWKKTNVIHSERNSQIHVF